MLLEVKVLYGNQLKMKITLYDPSNTHEIVFLASTARILTQICVFSNSK